MNAGVTKRFALREKHEGTDKSYELALAREAFEKDVLRLRELGVDFDRDEKGHLMMTLEAGHSRHRIVHHKDSTGKAITDTLIEAVKERGNADIMENTMLFSLQKARSGFYAGLMRDGCVEWIGARYCILATGGSAGCMNIRQIPPSLRATALRLPMSLVRISGI